MNNDTVNTSYVSQYAPKTTKWHNPLPVDVTMKLYVGHDRDKPMPVDPWLHVTIAAGETVELLSTFDVAIHDERDLNGRHIPPNAPLGTVRVIWGGLCPHLINLTRPGAVKHPAIEEFEVPKEDEWVKAAKAAAAAQVEAAKAKAGPGLAKTAAKGAKK